MLRFFGRGTDSGSALGLFVCFVTRAGRVGWLDGWLVGCLVGWLAASPASPASPGLLALIGMQLGVAGGWFKFGGFRLA